MADSAITCPNGHENEAGSKFCETCGATLGAAAASTPPPGDAAIPAQRRQEMGQPATSPTQPGGGVRMRTVVLLAALIGIGAAVATGGLVFFLAGDDEEPAVAAEPSATATAQPSPTLEPTASSAPATAAPGASRETALALGVAKRGFNGWDLSIVRADFDAVIDVMNENQFNEPPMDGHTFMLVRIQATNVEAGDGAELETFTFSVQDDAGNEWRDYVEGCGVVPDDFSLLEPTADTGQFLEGNLCFQVPVDEIGNLMFYDDASNTWFALR